MEMESPYKGKTGLRRILNATRYSLAGLAAMGWLSSRSAKYWYCHVVPTWSSPLVNEEICFAASDQYSAEKNDHRHDRGGHEEEDQLLPVQLDFVEAVVLDLRAAHGAQLAGILANFSGEYKPRGRGWFVTGAGQFVRRLRVQPGCRPERTSSGRRNLPCLCMR